MQDVRCMTTQKGLEKEWYFYLYGAANDRLTGKQKIDFTKKPKITKERLFFLYGLCSDRLTDAQRINLRGVLSCVDIKNLPFFNRIIMRTTTKFKAGKPTSINETNSA